MGKRWGFLILVLVSLHLAAQPANEDCSQLIYQIKAMNKAQQTLLSSMLRKNDSMAETLDQFAFGFEKKGHRVQRVDLVSMKLSAQAFRKHGEREKSLVGRFEKSTEALLTKVESCLVAKPLKPVESTSELVQR